MQATATTKYTEALAVEIAEHIPGATVAFDRDVDSYVVRIRAGRARYELVANAPAGIHGVFRNSNWHCGMNVGRDATPASIAREFSFLATAR
jgi:hypothetical protein